ncbi:vacuolar amino acid transporter 3, partial [Aureobasidium melanogenum]
MSSPASRPLEIRSTSRGPSPAAASPHASSHHSRHASIARLSSPVPSHRLTTPPVPQVPVPQQVAADHNGNSTLPKLDSAGSLPGPGQSALSSALADQSGQKTPTRVKTPTPSTDSTPKPPSTTLRGGLGSHDRIPRSNYGSFEPPVMAGSPAPTEDPEVVKRHLVQPDQGSGRNAGSIRLDLNELGTGLGPDEFSSLRLQGGDMTRAIYRWAEDQTGNAPGRTQRSKSFFVPRPEPEAEDIQNIRVPGGFRRNYIRRAVQNPGSTAGGSDAEAAEGQRGRTRSAGTTQPKFFTNNFLEFLTLYGHFAGEDLEEDDEALGPDEYFSSDAWDEGSDQEPGEDSALLAGSTHTLRKRKHKERPPTGNNSSMNAALLLLKSFVGTGVLFLPRAFLNGGMLFSSLVLIGVAALSFHCFILLTNTRNKVEASFGEMGGILYGKWLRTLILFSIVLSQIGFVSAYIVFTAENLQAFVLAVSKCKSFIDIKFMVMMQLVIFLPLSLIRDISKLGFTALIADAFIMLGLLYLYYYDISEIVYQGGVADITLFNPSSWTLFIGTAIFTFEGVGLIIPIQESMRKPEKFPGVLGIVMIAMTILFTSIGALSYAAYGSKTKTVVILNLPQDNKVVNAVQFLYSLAILLSTPLQLFPAVRIMENELFSRSGKYNPWIKWQKNVFRFCLVCVCALIAWGGAGDLDKFVALVGSFACVPLVYVYPPMLHLKAVAKGPWQRGLDYVVCVFGFVGCIYTTVLTVQQWAAGGSTKTPGYCDS